VAKLLTLAAKLQHHELLFAGTGVALELAATSSLFVGSMSVDPSTEQGCRQLLGLLRSADACLSVIEPDVVALAAKQQVPCCYVDSLFWMWDKLPDHLRSVDLYVAQRFPGVEAQAARIPVKNLIMVGPIIDRSHLGEHRQDDVLLVNLAGLESPFVTFGSTLHYPEAVMPSLAEALGLATYRNVVVTGNRTVMGDLAWRYPAPGVTYMHLSHDAFLAQMARARMVLTSPGLTTTYEALVHGTPVRFLPPQNYSQALLLDRYRRQGLSDVDFTWSDADFEAGITSGLPESEGVSRVLRAIERAIGSEKVRIHLLKVFEQMLTLPVPDVHQQRERLGEPLTDGALEACTALEAMLAARSRAAVVRRG
jgi:hydroxymethylcytosylglucuronate/cytosylglucuronate synthase